MDNLKKDFINNLIRTQKLVFIGSMNENGFPNIRAMLKPLKREDVKTIYFLTNGSTSKIKHYADNPKACVYFYNENLFHSAMLRGEIEIISSKEQKRLQWNYDDEIHIPREIDDPNFYILKFTASSCRCYYDLKSEEVLL